MKNKILVIFCLIFVVFISSCNSNKEKEKIVKYYNEMSKWVETPEYKNNYIDYKFIKSNYIRIAKLSGFDNDDVISSGVGAHYEKDVEVMQARDEWIYKKKKIDSELIIKNR